MSDNDQWTFQGKITNIKDGKFENQKKCEIVGAGGESLSAQFYTKKKDGTQPKVLPKIKDSFINGKEYNWTGGKASTSNEHGDFTFYTITWAFDAETDPENQDPFGNGPSPNDGGDTTSWGSESSSPSTQQAVETVTEAFPGSEVVEERKGNVVTKPDMTESYVPPDDVRAKDNDGLTSNDAAHIGTDIGNWGYDAVTREIEAAWAIKALVDGGFKVLEDQDKTATTAVQLVTLKRRIASELK